jgi:hypothetical protein
MSDHQKQALRWAQDVLPAQACHSHKKVIAQTAYSYVVQFETEDGVFYLKQTPPALYAEAAVLTTLATVCAVQNVPQVIAHNDMLHCFLMPSCGGETLRHLFENGGRGFDPALYQRGVDGYIAIQKKATAHTGAFLDQKLAVDWRYEHLPAVYAAFLSDRPAMDAWGLSPEDQNRAERSRDYVEKLVRDLSALGLPDTLLHCDLHQNAMLMDHKTARINIIDWGEVAIGNPLLPFADCITQSLNNRYQLLNDAALTQNLIKHVFESWALPFSHEREKLFMLLGPFAAIISYCRLMLLSDYIFTQWAQWKKPLFLHWLSALEEHYGKN